MLPCLAASFVDGTVLLGYDTFRSINGLKSPFRSQKSLLLKAFVGGLNDPPLPNDAALPFMLVGDFEVVEFDELFLIVAGRLVFEVEAER